MIYKPKGRKHYRVKFKCDGRTIRQCTKATDRKTARAIEARLKSELARGNWGILEAKPAPPLGEFLKADFMPFTETRFATKSKTLAYYQYGVKRLLASEIVLLKLDQINGQHAAHLAARLAPYAASTINCTLRTLRRALALAMEWGKLDRMPKIALAKGERQRERVLSEEEIARYLECCPQPWHDVALVILGTGMRPGEVYRLRWESVRLRGDCPIIQVSEGKSRAARRELPMHPRSHWALKARHLELGSPAQG